MRGRSRSDTKPYVPLCNVTRFETTALGAELGPARHRATTESRHISITFTTLAQRMAESELLDWALRMKNNGAFSGGENALISIVHALAEHFDEVGAAEQKAIADTLVAQWKTPYRDKTVETLFAEDPVLPTVYYYRDPHDEEDTVLEGLLRVLLSDFDRMDARFQGEVARAVGAQANA